MSRHRRTNSTALALAVATATVVAFRATTSDVRAASGGAYAHLGRARDDRAEVARRLEQLASSSGALRLDAQRWLSTHLADDDWPAVARAATGGDLELRRRLVEAIATSDENLGLAVRAASEPDSRLARLGQEALAEMLARWIRKADAGARRGADVLFDVGEEPLERLSIDPDGRLADVIDRLARFASSQPALVLDPQLDATVRDRIPDRGPSTGRLTGTWPELIEGICTLHRVELEGFAFEGGRPARRWVRVCKSGDEGEASALRLLSSWCVGVERERATVAAACARALAASRWPAALSWLERRWVAEGDPAALAGVLLAAARGRVVPTLFRPDSHRRLYAHADDLLARGDATALLEVDRIARALAGAGAVGSSGEDLSTVALEEFDELGPRSRWVRLVVLEGQRSGSSDALAVAEAALIGPTGDRGHALRLQGLRALSAFSIRRSAAPRIDDLTGLWSYCVQRDLAGELVEHLVLLGVPPPAEWSDPARLPQRPAGLTVELGLAARTAMLQWWAFRATATGDPSDRRALAAHLSAALPQLGEPRLREVVAELARRGAAEALGRVLGELAAAAPRLEADALVRLRLASGAVGDAEQAELLRRARASSPDRGDALLTLAALAGGSSGTAALEVLIERIDGPALAADRVEALLLAERVLHEARREMRSEALERLVTAKRPGGWFVARWRRQRRVAASRVPTRVLEREDRSLALSGL